MRSILFSLALVSASACATTSTVNHAGHVNVAAVRSEISGSIRASGNDRTIQSMGHVEATKAVVYTTNTTTGAKQEETWTKNGDAWKLEGSTTLAGGAPATPRS